MYENKTYDAIKADILKEINSVDAGEGSFVNDMVSPISMEFESNYAQLEKLLGVMFLEDSNGEYLEKRGSEYGVYRKKGSFSVGTATFGGNIGVTIPKGSLVSGKNSLIFETQSEAVFETTEISVEIKAQGIGEKYNLPPNSILNIPVGIVGVTSVFNPTETLGGTNLETDTELLNRVLYMLRNPATSGNAAHYKMWATQVEGVGDAKIFPLKNGNGTVVVMPITSVKRSPPPQIIQKIATHIEGKRPIGADVSVTAPTEVLINVTATVVAVSGRSSTQILKDYTSLFESYIKESVFNLYWVDYYKCLSFLYDVAGVSEVVDFKINGITGNIAISPTDIQVVGSISINS